MIEYGILLCCSLSLLAVSLVRTPSFSGRSFTWLHKHFGNVQTSHARSRPARLIHLSLSYTSVSLAHLFEPCYPLNAIPNSTPLGPFALKSVNIPHYRDQFCADRARPMRYEDLSCQLGCHGKCGQLRQ